MIHRPHRPRFARAAVPAMAVLGTLGVAGSAVAGAPDDPAEPGPSVLDAGTGETIELPVPYAVGQAVNTQGTFATSMSIEGGGVDEDVTFTISLALDSEVVELTDGGGAIVSSLITDASAEADDPSLDLSSIGDVSGVAYLETYSREGVVLETTLLDEDALTPEQQTAAQDILSSAQSVDIEFPEGEVGLGARWTADATIESQGLSIPVTYEYELVALDAETFTVSIDYGADIDAEIQGVDVSGRVSGSGTLLGDRDNRLVSTLDIAQVVAMEMDGQGSIEMQIDVDMAATEAAGDTGATAAGSAPAAPATTLG